MLTIGGAGLPFLKIRPTNKRMNTFRPLKIFTGKLNNLFNGILKAGISVLPPITR
nr:MAG TPA: hypothetical protein [Caudoviricetes sp.]